MGEGKIPPHEEGNIIGVCVRVNVGGKGVFTLIQWILQVKPFGIYLRPNPSISSSVSMTNLLFPILQKLWGRRAVRFMNSGGEDVMCIDKKGEIITR